jgi:hypothetical protein
MIRLRMTLEIWLALTGFYASVSVAAALPPADWSLQFGGYGGDAASAVAIDETGSAYIAGWTQGTSQDPAPGGDDVYLKKFSSSGAPLWTRQFGSDTPFEGSTDIALGDTGNLYISAGVGDSASSVRNAFIGKFSADGDLIWDRRLSVPEGSFGTAVAVGGASLQSVYLAGTSLGTLVAPAQGRQDGFVRKYDSEGNDLWTRQISTNLLDKVHAVSADSFGNVYVAGSTEGSLAAPNQGRDDLYIQKRSPEGDLLWTHQDGTNFDDAITELAIDHEGYLYASGYTQNGSLNGGVPKGYDAFLRKLDQSGNEIWTQSIAQTGHDYATGVAIGADGRIYVSGRTTAPSTILSGTNFWAFYAVYDMTGVLHEYLQFAPESELTAVATNSIGHVIFAGHTFTDLYATNQGTIDAFLIRQTRIPEPLTSTLTIMASLGAFFMRRRSRRVIARRVYIC